MQIRKSLKTCLQVLHRHRDPEGGKPVGYRHEYMTEEYDSPKTYIKEVKSINSLTDVDKIYAGQRIVIPYYSTELK